MSLLLIGRLKDDQALPNHSIRLFSHSRTGEGHPSWPAVTDQTVLSPATSSHLSARIPPPGCALQITRNNILISLKIRGLTASSRKVQRAVILFLDKLTFPHVYVLFIIERHGDMYVFQSEPGTSSCLFAPLSQPNRDHATRRGKTRDHCVNALTPAASRICDPDRSS